MWPRNERLSLCHFMMKSLPNVYQIYWLTNLLYCEVPRQIFCSKFHVRFYSVEGKVSLSIFYLNRMRMPQAEIKVYEYFTEMSVCVIERFYVCSSVKHTHISVWTVRVYYPKNSITVKILTTFWYWTYSWTNPQFCFQFTLNIQNVSFACHNL